MANTNPFAWLTGAPSLLFGQQEPAGTRSTTGKSLGVDIPLVQDTPIATAFGGRVVTSTYAPWGGQVDIATRIGNTPVVEEFLHLDQNFVRVGQNITEGTLVGLSGGQLSGGIHNATAQFSTGPHIKFSTFFGNTAAAESPRNAFDPSGILQVAAAAAGGVTSVDAANAASAALGGVGGVGGDAVGAALGGLNPSSFFAPVVAPISQIVKDVAFVSSGDFAKIIFGALLIGVAFFIFIQPEVKQGALLGLEVAGATA